MAWVLDHRVPFILFLEVERVQVMPKLLLIVSTLFLLVGCPSVKAKDNYLKCMEDNPSMENNDDYCSAKHWHD